MRNTFISRVCGAIDKCRFIYIMAFMIFLCKNDIVYFSTILPGVQKLLFVGFSAFGVLLILSDLLNNRFLFKSKYNLCLLLLIVVTAVSSILSYKYGLANNAKTLVWMSIHFFLLYSLGQGKSMERVSKEIKIFTNTYIVMWFVAVMVSFVQFVLQVNYSLPKDEPGKFYRQGFVDNRLFGVFTDPNYASLISLIVIVFAVMNFSKTKKVWVKVCYIISIIAQYFYVLLSGSRTSILAGIIGIGILIWYFIIRSLKNKNKCSVSWNIISAVLSIFICFTILVTISPIKKMLAYIPSVYSMVAQMGQNNEKPEDNSHFILHPVNMNRTDVDDNDDISNLRFKIWGDSLEIFKNNPLFGSSPRNHLEYAKDKFSDMFIVERNYQPHNAYLCVLVYTGILGTIPTVVYIFLILRLFALYILKGKKDENSLLVIPILSIISIVAIAGIMLMVIFFSNIALNLIFWTFLGYATYIMDVELKDLGVIKEKEPIMQRLTSGMLKGNK